MTQWLGHHLLMWRVWVPSLVRELRSMPHGQKAKTENRSNIVTNKD